MGHYFSNYQFTSYSFALLLTTVVGLVVALALWHRRTAPGAVYLALLELAVAEWALAVAFESAAIGISLKVLWSKIAYLGTASGPLFYFFFAFEYSQQAKALSPRRVALLSVVPVVTVVIAATNELHHWLWTEISLNQDSNIAIYGHGAWFWIFVAYVYVLLSVGVILLYRAMFRLPAFYHSRVGLLLFGSALPLVGNIIYVSGLNPIPGLDWTPVTFGLTGIVLAWGIFRLQMFDLMPIARHQLIESMDDGVLVLDERNRVVDVNPSAQRLLADANTSLIGHTAEQVLAAWPQLVVDSGGGPASTEIVLGRTEPRFVDVRISPLYDQRKRFIGELVVLRDITERKRAEEALRKLNFTLEAKVAARTAEIRAEKEKIETILGNLDDAIVLTDLGMRIQYVNAAFTDLTGYTIEELLGQRTSSVGIGVGGEPYLRPIEATLAQGAVWQGEVTCQRKDGRTYNASLTVAPVRDVDGQLMGYVSSCRDISQQKELDRARSRFVTNVSHELRTPVTNVKLYTWLLKTGRRPEDTRQYLEVLARQAELLEHLTQDILELAALDSGQGVTIWEPLYLSTFITDAVLRHQVRAEASGVVLRAMPVPPDLPLVKGDQSRLLQALEELVENAVTFTPAGGRVTVEVGIVEEEEQCWVTIAVHDTGPGISLEEQGRVFDRFYRGSVAESGHIPGTGLGLSIVWEIMRAHGGQVTVESEMGQGSTFTLWLRAVPDTAD
jgi:PAS domain S-box-containing protein